ncbi:MAG: hypothetical protein IT288_13670 [Bdellovibrionales bacterium]|nr:hypothetical protein [Bdellovibrionales bacterium]
MKKLIASILLAVVASQAMATENLTSAQRNCLDAWASVFTEGDMSAPEFATNAGTAVIASIGGLSTSKATGSLRFAFKAAIGAAVVGGIVLAANQEWEIIDRLFKEAQVGAGAALSDLGQALQEEGNQMSTSKIVDGIKAMDPREESFAQYFCTQNLRPVILGRYIEQVINIK